MRLALIISGLVGLLLAGLLLLGDSIEVWLSSDEGLNWLRAQGSWAGMAGVGLIVADLLLPIPASGVMAALGEIYGGFIGGLYASIGSVCAGLLAYGLVRMVGRRAALFLAGEKHIERLQYFFDKKGAWAIALTRPLPLIPEVLACLAGLAPMPFSRFFVALCCGSFPAGFVFATLGSIGDDQPARTILIASLLPFFVFPPVWWLINRKRDPDKSN